MTDISPADQQQAREIVQAREAEAAAITSINAGHEECMRLGQSSSETLLALLNKIRETGLHLIELKRRTRHGAWLDLFASADGLANPNHVLDFDAQTGRNYMRTAQALPAKVLSLPDGARSLRDALVATGVLPASTREEQEARGTLGWLSQSERVLMSFNSILGKRIEKAALNEWQTTELETLDTQLEPFEKRRAEVQAELSRRSA